jgi:hypothetical protein
MMSKLAKKVRTFYCGVPNVILHRFEVSGEYKLSESTVQLLNDDPAAAIRSMSHPDRKVVIPRIVCAPKDELVTQSLLRAGHETLADAFGFYTYFRLKNGKIECPHDGRWKEYSVVTAYNTPGVYYQGPVTDEYSTLWFSPNIVNEKWARTFTKTLLDVWKKKGLSRYFLPRAWNKSGPWISHEDLKQKYETFCKEREECLVQVEQRE